jgi:hypothetical protein
MNQQTASIALGMLKLMFFHQMTDVIAAAYNVTIH